MTEILQKKTCSADLDNLQKMGFTEFHRYIVSRMPGKLYKYFPNRYESMIDENTGKERKVNYSVQALRNNTVFMQLPHLFDDVYDSDINVTYKEFESAALEEYCLRSGAAISESVTSSELERVLVQKISDVMEASGNVDSLFQIPPETERDSHINQRFLLLFWAEYEIVNNIHHALQNVIRKAYTNFINSSKNTFRISCFTTTPYSQLMWGGAYADFHQGFCVEYTVLPYEEQYRDLIENLFPVVYCKVRPKLTKEFLKHEYHGLNSKTVWDLFFHGVLRKSID